MKDWILPTDDLPEERKPVLVQTDEKYFAEYDFMQVAYWINDSIDGEVEPVWYSKDSQINVVCWQPLPGKYDNPKMIIK